MTARKIWTAGDPMLAADINANFKFGGDGSDGALSITSGATNIDCANAHIVVKNYTSVSITGTASLTFTNPHANGTIVILKSQGNVTITSSANPTIDLRSMGAGGGSQGNAGNPAYSSVPLNLTGGATNPNSSSGGSGGTGVFCVLNPNLKVISVAPGAGGGGGDASTSRGGAGGRGGGGLYIECGGALNFTGVINLSGANGGATTSGGNAGGGGGGGAGNLVILYGSLTANSGTVTATGGTGGLGTTGSFAGGAGGTVLNLATGSGTGGSGGGSSSLGGGAGGGAGRGGNAGSGGTSGGGTGGGAGGGGGGGSYYIGFNTEFA